MFQMTQKLIAFIRVFCRVREGHTRLTLGGAYSTFGSATALYI